MNRPELEAVVRRTLTKLAATAGTERLNDATAIILAAADLYRCPLPPAPDFRAEAEKARRRSARLHRYRPDEIAARREAALADAYPKRWHRKPGLTEERNAS